MRHKQNRVLRDYSPDLNKSRGCFIPFALLFECIFIKNYPILKVNLCSYIALSTLLILNFLLNVVPNSDISRATFYAFSYNVEAFILIYIFLKDYLLCGTILAAISIIVYIILLFYAKNEQNHKIMKCIAIFITLCFICGFFFTYAYITNSALKSVKIPFTFDESDIIEETIEKSENSVNDKLQTNIDEISDETITNSINEQETMTQKSESSKKNKSTDKESNKTKNKAAANDSDNKTVENSNSEPSVSLPEIKIQEQADPLVDY